MKFDPKNWKLSKCDDGTWMIHTEGDVICYGDNNRSDEENQEILNCIIQACQDYMSLSEDRGF